ncbi:exosome complex component RRP43-like [Zophobas morio]|uniref:exosome complex component RRP43-like n=1 Tax=Zophobas morio TaxID=2755281 RepID=UPI0030834D65
MQAETFRKVHPTEYYNQFLRKNIRPDGRKFMEFRETGVEIDCFESAVGSSVVRIGNTSVMCSVQAKFAPPTERHPKQGFIVPAVVISPVCSSKNRKQATDYAAHLTNLIVQRVLATGNKASIVVDLNQLCIVEKEIVWVLYADITCLDDDGALEDAVMMAFQSALQSVKLPQLVSKGSSDVPQINTKTARL